VVGRVIGDVAATVCLFDAADAVLETRCPRDRPRPSKSLGITQVGPELGGAVVTLVIGFGRELHAQVG
jgi:hypothetical protein